MDFFKISPESIHFGDKNLEGNWLFNFDRIDPNLLVNIYTHGVLDPVVVYTKDDKLWCYRGTQRVRVARYLKIPLVDVLVLDEDEGHKPDVEEIQKHYTKKINLFFHKILGKWDILGEGENGYLGTNFIYRKNDDKFMPYYFGQGMIFVVYYTPSYREDLEKYFLPSVKNLNLEYETVPVKDMGNWSYNTYYTPSVMLDMLDKHKKMVVKVGADSYFHEFPKYFDELRNQEFDIAITFIPSDPPDHADCSVVVANNTGAARDFLNRWNDRCREKIQQGIKEVFSDEDVLDEIKGNVYPLVKLVKLNHHYGQSWHFDRQKMGSPIIEDFRTSWNHDRNKV